MRDISELRAGRVRVAALPSLAATAVPAAFARFAALYPQIRLEMLDSLSGPAFELVRTGQADFALTAANPAYPDLAYQPLGEDPFVLLLPAEHPLALQDRPLRWDETWALPHVSMPLPTSVRQYADKAFLQNGLSFAPQYEVEHLATINAMVAAGLGVAALPELAALVARGPRVVKRPLLAPVMMRQLGLVTLRGRSPSPAAAALIEMLREATQALLQAS